MWCGYSDCGEYRRRETNRFIHQLQFVGRRLWGTSPEYIGRNMGGTIILTFVDQDCCARVDFSECYTPLESVTVFNP
jgi:hypothetical protein